MPAHNRDFTGGPGQLLLTKVNQQGQLIRDKTALYRALAERFPSGGKFDDFTDLTRAAVDQ